MTVYITMGFGYLSKIVPGGGSCGFYLLSLKMYISRKFIRLIGFPSTFDRHCVLDHKGTDDLVLFSRKDLGLSFSLASLSHTR